jgi:hypothetical protein
MAAPGPGHGPASPAQGVVVGARLYNLAHATPLPAILLGTSATVMGPLTLTSPGWKLAKCRTR